MLDNNVAQIGIKIPFFSLNKHTQKWSVGALTYCYELIASLVNASFQAKFQAKFQASLELVIPQLRNFASQQQLQLQTGKCV